MTWSDRLSAELSFRGVPLRERARIVLELEDHIACEPGCEERLGDPRELAVSFAEELATSRARSSAFQAFWALGIAAVALALSQLAIGHAGGYPGFENGLSLVLVVPALFGLLVAPQVALVAGTLAAVRALRRRRARRLPAAEIWLLQRRTRVALLAGVATVAGLELYVVNFSQILPAWYLGLIGGAGALAGVAVGATLRGLDRTRAIISSSPGTAGDVYDDVPGLGWRWLRRRPWRLGAIASLTVAAVATLIQAHAERSLSEGLQRGIAEGLAVALGYAVLGRTVGLFASRREAGGAAYPELATAGGFLAGPGEELIAPRRDEELIAPDDRLLGDGDRSRAERVLRESFADGRLSVDELTARVSAVHDAGTLGQLRDALSGLPPAR